MPSKNSAGLLLFERGPAGLQVLLAHPGGPFFKNKDLGSWTIPKGELDGDEDAEIAARREFVEETGLPVHEPLLPLGEVRQKTGKVVTAWAFAGVVPPDFVPRSNTFEIEWPPRSGRRATFPEIDRAQLFTLDEARRRIIPAQEAFLERLFALVGS